jgi:hypothetical protein
MDKSRFHQLRPQCHPHQSLKFLMDNLKSPPLSLQSLRSPMDNPKSPPLLRHHLPLQSLRFLMVKSKSPQPLQLLSPRSLVSSSSLSILVKLLTCLKMDKSKFRPTLLSQLVVSFLRFLVCFTISILSFHWSSTSLTHHRRTNPSQRNHRSSPIHRCRIHYGWKPTRCPYGRRRRCRFLVKLKHS